VKLVLRSDVAQVGKKGDIVDVSDGYGRNFLLPKGLAFVASDGVEAQAAKMRQSRDLRDASDRAAAQEVATSLVPKVVTIAARAGAEGKLFGSVSTAEIADAVAAQTGVTLDRRVLHLDEPIKTVGTHLVPAKLHAEVEFPITVEVVAS
jgi:large subunit ribosomal protein L9